MSLSDWWLKATRTEPVDTPAPNLGLKARLIFTEYVQGLPHRNETYIFWAPILFREDNMPDWAIIDRGIRFGVSPGSLWDSCVRMGIIDG